MTLQPLDRHDMPLRRQDKHIVMLVANGVTGDSRVQKTAISASEAGYRVTVIGMSKTGRRYVESLGGARVVRIPVPFTTFNAAKRGLAPKGRVGAAARTVKRLGKLDMKVRRQSVSRAQKRLDRLKQVGAARRQLANLRLRIVAFEALARLDRLGVLGADRVLRWSQHRAAPAGDDEAAERKLFRAKLTDFERAYLRELRHSDFDLVHAHDFTMIECANSAVVQAARDGGRPPFVYDAHEWVRGLTHLPRGTQAVSVQVEAENIAAAHSVVTVSPVLAERLQRENSLADKPGLVLNAPVASAVDPLSPLSVRTQAGLDDETPLAVYGGAVKASRGIGTLIRALPLLPDLHLAIVASTPDSAGVKEVLTEALEHGCRDRVHLVGYVAPDQVSNYLRTADVGVHPLLRCGNAELALPNKIFEYLHAGLPMVVSDMPAMSELVVRHEWGAVFAAGDHEALAGALRSVLADRDAYRSGLHDPVARERYSWEHQARTLIDTYDRLLFGLSSSDKAARDLGTLGTVS